MTNAAVLISGRGSNLQAIINYWEKGNAAYDLKIVISNRADAHGLRFARKAGIPAKVISHENFDSPQSFDQEVSRILKDHGVELIALAGFMRLLSPWFVGAWSGKVLNIHPSLLPAFPGLKSQGKALKYGVKYSGCTVFFVDEGVDSGAIINQAVVKLEPNDTDDSLSSRILKQEHLIFPEALHQVASGNIYLQNGKVITR